MDGYVVEKPTDASYLRHRTTRDFGAQEIEWASGDSLAILSADLSKRDGTSSAIYRTRQGDEILSVDEVSTSVLAMSPLPDGGLLIAREEGASTSALATTDDGGQVSQTYPSLVQGKVSGLSVSPDGDKAVLAMRAEGSGRFAILGFDLSDGTSWRIADLPRDEEVFGAPQWTEHGVFYVAGEEKAAQSEDAAPYYMYRLPLDSGTPGPVPGVGEDFVASSLRASPDGERLAIVGRRNLNSPTDLYVLDLKTDVLEAVTANENMEIKTSPPDLSWSADGGHIAIVARGILSGSRVYQVRAGALLADFYNVYDVPVGDSG
jgi:TolB protein